MKFTEILKSRNFQATLVGLILLIFKGFGVDLPEEDAGVFVDQIAGVIDIIIIYLVTPILSIIAKIRQGVKLVWTMNMSNQVISIVAVIVGFFFGEEIAGITVAILSNLMTVIYYSTQPSKEELSPAPTTIA